MCQWSGTEEVVQGPGRANFAWDWEQLWAVFEGATAVGKDLHYGCHFFY